MMERSIDVKTRHYPQGNDNTHGIKKIDEEESKENRQFQYNNIFIFYSYSP